MSTSSGEIGFCRYCGHPLDGHTKASHSKCKQCKKRIFVCQAGQHQEGGGWRICHVPCGCGRRYYPSTAAAARPLEPSEYASSHPDYESPTIPEATSPTHAAIPDLEARDNSTVFTNEPTYAETFNDGYRLGFYDHNGGVIWTTQNDWRSTTTRYEGASAPCFQFDDANTGCSYFTWKLGEDDRQGTTEPDRSEQSHGDMYLPRTEGQSSAAHARSLSEESDPLQWDQKRIEAETIASAMSGLTVGGGRDSQQSEGPSQSRRTVPVSAHLNHKGMVAFTVKAGEDSGKKLVSPLNKWVPVDGGYIFDSISAGCTFFAKEIKPAKK
ncbi:hypothetical protein MGN70_009396 [Eutypa lata]|nr:hypothetical protein MGN70_009396 [Eutypa lata]